MEKMPKTTELLPLSFIRRPAGSIKWMQQMEWTGCSAGLQKGVAPSGADWQKALTQNRQQLKRLTHQPEMRFALQFSSHHLLQRMDRYQSAAKSSNKKMRQLERGLMSYLLRFTTRPTPFGPFAGVCFSIPHSPVQSYRLSCNLDWLAEIDSEFPLVLNESLLKIDDRWEYLLFRQGQYYLAAFENTALWEAFYQKGIKEAFTKTEWLGWAETRVEAPQEDILHWLEQRVQDQLLVPQIAPHWHLLRQLPPFQNPRITHLLSMESQLEKGIPSSDWVEAETIPKGPPKLQWWFWDQSFPGDELSSIPPRSWWQAARAEIAPCLFAHQNHAWTSFCRIQKEGQPVLQVYADWKRRGCPGKVLSSEDFPEEHIPLSEGAPAKHLSHPELSDPQAPFQVLYQPFRENTNWKARLLGVSPGPFRLAGRFLHLLPDVQREDLQQAFSSDKDYLLAEIREFPPANENDSPAMMPYQLLLPGCQPPVGTYQKLDIHQIRWGKPFPPTGSRLYYGKDLRPLALFDPGPGTQHSDLWECLLLSSVPRPTLPPDWETTGGTKTSEEVIHWPRLWYGQHWLLRPARWQFPYALLAPRAGRKARPSLFEVWKKHQLPQRFLLYLPDALPGQSQWIDLHIPLMHDYLLKQLDKQQGNYILEEVYPAPAQMPRINGEPFVQEWVG